MSSTNDQNSTQESKPRGRPRKYASDEERKAAVKAQKHAWYLKNKEKKAALKEQPQPTDDKDKNNITDDNENQ